MDPEKTGFSTLFQALVGEVTFPGKIATFFGTLFTLVGVFASRSTFWLSGVGLLSFAIANHYWSTRHVGVYVTGEDLPWYQDIIWPRLFLSVVFFLGFLVASWYWFHLPPVVASLEAAGISNFGASE